MTYSQSTVEALKKQGVPEHLAVIVAEVCQRENNGGSPRSPEEQKVITDAWHCYAKHHQPEEKQ